MGKIMKNSVEYGTVGSINDVTVNGTSVVTSGVASIPLVSSTSAGVAPKGASVSSQSQSTKFLREDGSWATPSYTSVSDKANIDGSNIVDVSAFRSAIGAQGQLTFYDDTTGTTELALPSSWNTILIQTVYSYYNITSIYTYGMVSNNYTNISLGNYGTSYAVGKLRRDKVQLSTMNWGGTDVTANTKLYIYLN